MAVRTPLYWNGSDIQEMSSAQINQIVDQVVYQYSLNPSVSLSVVASSGSLDSMTDTRKTAGAALSRADRYPTEAETAEPGTVTVTYDKIDQLTASTLQITDTSNKAFPVYYSSGSIQSMSLTDVQDTFFEPAINLLTSGTISTQQAGTYRIHSANSLAGHTLVSNTPVFLDTRANAGAYSFDGIPETEDQPITMNAYYLMKINGSDTSYTAPLYINGTDLQTYSDAAFETILQNGIRHMATSTTGFRISYNINGTGTNRGTAMINTVLNGSGDYQTLFVNADDYRAQEFPNGTAVTANTYYLKINKS